MLMERVLLGCLNCTCTAASSGTAVLHTTLPSAFCFRRMQKPGNAGLAYLCYRLEPSTISNNFDNWNNIQLVIYNIFFPSHTGLPKYLTAVLLASSTTIHQPAPIYHLFSFVTYNCKNWITSLAPLI